MAYVEVAVNTGLPQRGSFSYAVPEGMTLAPGDAVFVPFGRRQLQGIVTAVSEVPAFESPKPVEARIGDEPALSEAHVRLGEWMAAYYMAPLFASLAPMLPPGFERKPLTFYEPLLSTAEADLTPMPPRQRLVLRHLIERGRAEGSAVAKELRLPGVERALAQLTQRGLARRAYGLARPRVRQKTVRSVALLVPAARALAEAEALEGRRQGRLARTLRALAEAGPLRPVELRARTGLGIAGLRPLAEAGLVEVRDEPRERDPLAGREYPPRPWPALTAEQEAALRPVAEALAAGAARAFLLHGVTGSGKTEVYLRALRQAVELGKRAIVLVPEIALTPQTVRRFAERFPGRVAVLHSALSEGERFDQWHGVRAGRYDVVIGSRSALFAPQPDLGLIVIDEEHEWTYKQEEPPPRYHAREVAERLAALSGAVLLMGSATPDVVSYQRAMWGRYELLTLRERIRPVIDATGAVVGVSSSPALPPVEVVDMREELKSGNRSVFSRSLQLALYQALEAGEQAILFLNRRGTAGFLQCRDCGYVPQCPSCAIALSYHKRWRTDGREAERLLCHECGKGRRPFERCPMCGGSRLRPMGTGVERVEEEVAALFREARILRWDRDVTRGRYAHEEILASFVAGEADVLIGTQMVAKGLDLPAVTLVGVISADIGLHIPDFRSAERTFQLLTQVSGRAGRALAPGGGPPKGRVVVQTYTPETYAIVAASQHDYGQFFTREVELRRLEGYPPFVRMARLVYSHANGERAQGEAERLARLLRTEAERLGLPGVDVVGPAPPHVPKWRSRFRWQVTLRAPDPTELLAAIRLPGEWTVDIDPVSLA
jgi:primosomal protein N' (replication factor Y)